MVFLSIFMTKEIDIAAMQVKLFLLFGISLSEKTV